jgi:PhnB protein
MSIVPQIIVNEAEKAIEFYRRAFGAVETLRLTEPGGRIGHAELAIAGAALMLSDAYPDYGFVAPEAGTASVKLSLYVPDVDAFAARAVAAGARLERPIADEFFGDRVASLADPFGHRWAIHTRIEEVSPDEMQRRFAALISGA